jgi:hypothetical protein
MVTGEEKLEIKELQIPIGERNAGEKNKGENASSVPHLSRCFRDDNIRYMKHFP